MLETVFAIGLWMAVIMFVGLALLNGVIIAALWFNRAHLLSLQTAMGSPITTNDDEAGGIGEVDE